MDAKRATRIRGRRGSEGFIRLWTEPLMLADSKPPQDFVPRGVLDPGRKHLWIIKRAWAPDGRGFRKCSNDSWLPKRRGLQTAVDSEGATRIRGR